MRQPFSLFGHISLKHICHKSFGDRNSVHKITVIRVTSSDTPSLPHHYSEPRLPLDHVSHDRTSS